MEDVLRKCNEMYDELVKEKQEVAAVRLQQGEAAKGLETVGNSLKQMDADLKEKAERFKVYEDIEHCEKANKAEMVKIEQASAVLQKAQSQLAEAQKEWAKQLASQKLEVGQAKEAYENELKAVKKTQAELKVKQDKVDKFLAQVK